MSSICRRADSTAPSYTSRSRASSRSARADTRAVTPVDTARITIEAIRTISMFLFIITLRDDY